MMALGLVQLDQQIMALVAPPSLPECVLAALDDGTVQAYDSVSMETLTSVDAPPRNPDQAYERTVLSHHDRASLPSTILEVLPDGATSVVSVIRFTKSSIPETTAATPADQGKKRKDKGKNRLSTAAPNVHAQGPTRASFDLLALSFPGEQDVEGELSALLTLVGRIDLPQLVCLGFCKLSRVSAYLMPILGCRGCCIRSVIFPHRSG